MTMKKRKMNNYSIIRISTVFVLAVALVTSTVAIPFLPRTGAEPLAPPNVPSDPKPANSSTNISINADLSWNCTDPDNDTVFDVYFGTSNPPDKVATAFPNTTYDPGTMNYSTKYFWQIIASDDNESTSGPIWEFRTKTNNPPIFGTPSPTNGSTGNPLSFVWSIPINDPEGNNFSWTIQCSNGLVNSGNGATNGTKTLSLSGLVYSKNYKVWVNATDTGGSGNYTRKRYTFTTKQHTELTVNITQPLENKLYFNDVEKSFPLPGNTIIYGKVTIKANVTSDSGVSKVVFYVDGKPKFNDTEAPYEYLWQQIISFNGLSLTHTIKVIAYDSEGHNASAQINVTKWRFHPLPWIMAGIAVASRLVLHTTVVGLFYNIQESRLSVSFYALSAHYKTVGPFQLRKGNLYFKHCTGGRLIGPTTITKLGLFHKFAIGSFTFIGNVNDNKIGMGGSLLTRILQRRSS